MDIDELRSLARWTTWSNRQVLNALRTSAGNPTNALAAFQHALEAEAVWLRRLDHDARPMLKLWDTPSLETCESLAAESATRWDAILARVERDGMAWTSTYRNSSGREFTGTPGDSLLQVLLHSSQYRGEATGFLHAAGHQPVIELDYIFWLREGSPA